MKSNIESVEDYLFTSKDQLFLDASIWMYLFGPSKPGNKAVSIYSQAFHHCLQKGCQHYIDELVFSEFMNAYSRFFFNQSKDYRCFKDYRKSPEFKPIAKEISGNAKRILGFCPRLDGSFSTLDIYTILDRYANESLDFND